MPLSDKQKEYLLNCNHRWNIKVGATGSGKSWLDYVYVIPKRLMCMRNEGAAVILGNTQGTAERNILDPMREIYGADLVGTISNNRANLFGKKVWVLGADNKKHVARIQGMTIEYAYGDEMTTWAEPVFQMLKSRLRCKHSYFDGTANPDSPSHYIKQFIDTAPDIFYQTSTIFDNPYLPKEFVENLCQEYAGTVYYKRYINGEWSQAEGLIYPNFEQVFESPPSNWQSRAEKFVLSIDYGTLNAFAALLWAKIEGVWYCTDGYYYSGRAEQRNKTDDDYVNDMVAQFGQFGNDFNKLRTIIDPSAASFITAMKRSRIFHAVSADNAVKDGIREVSVAIQRGKIKINPSLDFIKREFEGYVWNDDETPVKENDHCLTGDTLVITDSGTLPIKNLVGKCGKVWSYNTNTGKAELKKFSDCRLTQNKAPIYKIILESGDCIRCTGEHLILTQRGYIQAKFLTDSDSIIKVGV